MTSPQVDVQTRLYGMMQYLMSCAANQVVPRVAEPRGVVSKEDALNAVLQLAASIDAPAQAGSIPAQQGKWQASLLMVLHDYIQPLPAGMGQDADGGQSDHATADLREIVQAMHTGSQETGIHG